MSREQRLFSSNDPDDAGFVRWRAAFYVAGASNDALHNLLFLLDEYFVWANAGREVSVTVGLYPYLGVSIDGIWGQLQYDNRIMYENDRHLPIGPFEAQPPQGKRVMHLTIQPEDDENKVSVVFHGSTWFFRDLWADSGALPHSYDQEGVTQHCRVMEKVDVSKDDGQEKVFYVLDNVLKNLLVLVHVECEVSGPVRLFAQALRKRPDMVFA